MTKSLLLVGAFLLLSACGTSTPTLQTTLTAQKSGKDKPPKPPATPITLPPRPVVQNPPCSLNGPGVLPAKAFDLTFWYSDGSSRTGRWQTNTNYNSSEVTPQSVRSMEYADGPMVLSNGTTLFMQEKYGQGDFHSNPAFFFAENTGQFGSGFLYAGTEDAWGVFESATPQTNAFELTWLSTAGAYRLIPVTSQACRESYRLTLTTDDGTVSRALWTVNAVQNYTQVQLSQELWGSVQFTNGETVVAKGYKASAVDTAGFNVTTPDSTSQYVIWLGQAGDTRNLVLKASADPVSNGRPDAVIRGTFSNRAVHGNFVAERQ